MKSNSICRVLIYVMVLSILFIAGTLVYVNIFCAGADIECIIFDVEDGDKIRWYALDEKDEISRFIAELNSLQVTGDREDINSMAQTYEKTKYTRVFVRDKKGKRQILYIDEKEFGTMELGNKYVEQYNDKYTQYYKRPLWLYFDDKYMDDDVMKAQVKRTNQVLKNDYRFCIAARNRLYNVEKITICVLGIIVGVCVFVLGHKIYMDRKKLKA